MSDQSNPKGNAAAQPGGRPGDPWLAPVAAIDPAPSARLVSVAQMQAVERAADAAGHAYAVMMEVAGHAVAETIHRRYPGARVLVLAGPGNNGGDGLVCARYLHDAGLPVALYLWKRRTDPEHDDFRHHGKLVDRGVPWVHADQDPEWRTLRAWLAGAEVVVDALLGTGANRPIRGDLAELLDILTGARGKASRPALVAVDCVSGLNCDSGALDPASVPADVTVTFAHAKVGHYQFPGAAASGELVVAPIGTPPVPVDDGAIFVLEKALMAQWAPRRADNSHKGSFGKFMALVGSTNYAGAAYLACAAAGRTGAGLVTGVAPETVRPIVASRLAEATWLPVRPGPDETPGALGASALETVAPALAGYDALLMGCGLGQNQGTRELLRTLLAQETLPPTVIDADGLNLLAQMDGWPTRLPAATVLTPHPAELARLCGISVQEATARRWALAQEKAAAWNCVVLAKGPYTVIAEPGGRMAVLPVATAALATAGTGDVLAGAIGALLAQGLTPFRAACVGAWLHGRAGLRCAATMGNAGVVASDLLLHLPRILRELQ